MRQIRQILALSLIVLMTQGFSSQLRADSSHPNHLDLKAQAQDQVDRAQRFRDVFRDVAKKYGHDETAVRKMIYLPTADDLTTPDAAIEATTPEKSLAEIVKHAKKTSALAIYQNGVNTEFGPSESSDQVFKERGPATFIIVPALLQEVTIEPIFAEVIERPSAYRNRYQSYLARGSDLSYDWEKMQEVAVPLTSRVRLASIDDAAGEPLVQFIVLEAAFGSLDTIGTVKASSQTFLRRIKKVLALLPPEASQNLYFLGYSRGTAVSLDMIAEAHRAPPGSYPFLDRVRGLITLGGVVYGSELSDFPYAPLQLSLPQLPNPFPQPDPIFLMQQAYAFVSVLLKNSLDPIGNLKRLMVFQNAVNQAVEELKTSARLAWWKSHVLPEGFRVFSINGSMPVASMTRWPFPDSPFYGLNLLDYISMQPMAKRLFQLSGVYLNDGQILDAKGRLWPGLAEKINPQQPTLDMHNLGNVATHHLALGMRNAIRQSNGSVNTYPRALLLEALGAYALEAP